MVSKYQMIKEDIIQQIQDEVFLPGDKIYSEAKLRELYSVSNTTVVKALNNLVSEGYLIRKQGKGTYVRRNLINRKVLFSETSPASAIKGKAVERTETYISSPFKNKEISKKLGDYIGNETIIKVTQVAYVNDVPWKIQNRYLLEKKIPKSGIENIKSGGSITRELTGDTNTHVKMVVNIASFNRDDEELSPIRDYVEKNCSNETLLTFFDVQKVIMSLEKEILEFTQSYIDPDYYSIEVTTE